MRASICCVVGLVVLAGCGGGTESVTGTVTLDGDPLAGAEVEFTPKEGGRTASTTTDANGKFTLRYSRDQDGAPAGEYIVSITTATTKSGPGGEDIEVPEKLPPKYNIESELEVTVESGDNDFPFDLKSGPMTPSNDSSDDGGDVCE